MAKPKKETLDYGALCRALRRDGPARLYLLWGEEDYLLSRFAEELRKACLAEGTADFNAKRLEGPGLDADALAEALDAMPFGGGRTLVELRGVDINKCADERVSRLLGDVPEWCTVVITLPAGGEPDGRRSLTKLLKQSGVAVEFAARPENELFNWLTRRFQDHGKTIGRREMERLLFLSGTLMTRLIPEIDKVCAYAQGEAVTLADIDAVAHHLPEADVFELTDRIAAGDMDGAAERLAELLAGDEEPIMLTAVLGSQMRRLYAARLALDGGLGAPFVEETTGTRGFFVSRLMQSARAFTLGELRADVRLCAETDYRLKSDNSTAPDAVMAELLERLAMQGRHAAH